MKVRRQVASLEPLILDQLRGLEGEDWHRAPTGKWSVAQIVSHLGMATDRVALAFESDADATSADRRATPRQQLLRHLLLSAGKLPRPRRIPEGTYPVERPDPELIEAAYRMSVERLAALVETWPQERQENTYFRHSVLGDLNLPEWVRYFVVKGRHYAHQIEVRRRWLTASR